MEWAWTVGPLPEIIIMRDTEMYLEEAAGAA